ncbi:MAG: pilus assembly protein [Rhodospirillaceae bacterium]|nr:pilus assembly protein [Rhodospirillaceae bacterium]
MFFTRTLNKTRLGKAFLALPGCRRAATAIEFGFVFPIFLVMLMFIVEIGRALWIKGTMQYACEEAARYALVNPSFSTTTIATYANTVLTGTGMNVSGITFTAAQDTTNGVTFMTVSGSYAFQTLISLYSVNQLDVTLTALARSPQNAL